MEQPKERIRTMKGLIAPGKWIAAFAVVLSMALSGQALASSTQSCKDAWNDSEASDVCTTITLTYAQQTCAVRAGCLVTATLSDGTSTAETRWELSVHETGSTDTFEDFDVCFAASDSASNGYTAHFRSGCNDGEKTSSEIDGSTITVSSLP